ncbi:hypothetical protein NIES25_07510 [Nostoc linckia NIES-25]|nr:hypothetical protein NIES25_07510 [Nostoc linckia NIES-25]
MVIIKGPLCWENWKAKKHVKSWHGISEYPLFSDARIIGQAIDMGPYKLFDSIRITEDPKTPAIILRIEDYYDSFHNDDIKSNIKTTASRYHGGSLAEEIAALISLCLGIRIKAGLISRGFSQNGDPLGIPFLWNTNINPILLVSDIRYPILPDFRRTINLCNVNRIEKLPQLCEEDANALVRSARMYQDGVWMAESEPQLAWLMIISAIETAAGHWRKQLESPVERFKLFKPDLIPYLECAGGNELIETVAKALVDYMGATRKFVDFMIEFKPDPPTERPSEAYQISWEDNELSKIFKTIYSSRSQALHGGVAFPKPMCMPPDCLEDNKFAEKPSESKSVISTIDASWKAKNVPLFLHTFEYLARNVLLNWWDSMVKSNTASGL